MKKKKEEKIIPEYTTKKKAKEVKNYTQAKK